MSSGKTTEKNVFRVKLYSNIIICQARVKVLYKSSKVMTLFFYLLTDDINLLIKKL